MPISNFKYVVVTRTISDLLYYKGNGEWTLYKVNAKVYDGERASMECEYLSSFGIVATFILL